MNHTYLRHAKILLRNWVRIFRRNVKGFQFKSNNVDQTDVKNTLRKVEKKDMCLGLDRISQPFLFL